MPRPGAPQPGDPRPNYWNSREAPRREEPWAGEETEEEYKERLRQERLRRDQERQRRLSGMMADETGASIETSWKWQEEQREKKRREEAERVAKEIEASMWAAARGEETPAQAQYARQIGQALRAQEGGIRSIRGLSGQRAQRYAGRAGHELSTYGEQGVRALKAKEMQDAEQALSQYQAERDRLAAQYFALYGDAEKARQMAQLEYMELLNKYKAYQIETSAAGQSFWGNIYEKAMNTVASLMKLA